MLRILAILFTLAAALNDVSTAEAGIERRRKYGSYEWGSVTYNKEDKAEDMADMKKGKMYKKFSEMSKKKLTGMIKKYEKKIAIMKKVLKAKKKEKKN